jgi:hypothetical protein
MNGIADSYTTKGSYYCMLQNPEGRSTKRPSRLNLADFSGYEAADIRSVVGGENRINIIGFVVWAGR